MGREKWIKRGAGIDFLLDQLKSGKTADEAYAARANQMKLSPKLAQIAPVEPQPGVENQIVPPQENIQ